MRKERIRYLLELYCNDALAEAEATELSQLLDSTDHDEAVDILAGVLASAPTQEVAIDEGAIKAKVGQILAIDHSLQLQQVNHTPKIKLFKYSIRIAAAIVVLVGTYWLWQLQTNSINNQKKTTATVEKDIQPGKDGAILVLADGTEVLLDSARNSKVVVNKDGAKIKISQGQLVYLDSKNIKADELNSIRTPVGRKYNLTLSDGTKVWLNAASSIEYPIAFSKNNRAVTITGEAYFEVAKNASKPFIVSIKNSQTSIEVLGTHFNVNSYADRGNYQTTLLEGSILLHTGKRQYLLKPNQQAISQPLADQIQLVDDIDAEDILAWKNDLFQFKEADIDDVMRELARWYDIEVSYEGNKPQGTFTGKIGKDLTLKQTLKILGTTRVKYKLTDNNKLIIQ